MVFTHCASALLELNLWKSSLLIAALKGEFQTPIDVKETEFGDWYYNGTDNEHNFREVQAFHNIGKELDQMNALVQKLSHNSIDSNIDLIISLETDLVEHIHKVFEHLLEIQSLLFKDLN